MATSMANLNIESTVKLNNDVRIPILGLGVYQTPPGRVTQNAVKFALSVGYRHVDTARIYGNEADVGEAVRKSGVPREQLFVTTKLWNGDQGYDSTLRACEASLKRLGFDYLDLYLIHFPVPETRKESWKAMKMLLEKGECRAIGVSNFTIPHLEDLLEEHALTPAVNQIEFHPFLYQKELLEYCQRKGIQVEAYSPLARGEKMEHPRLTAVAAKYSKSPAQLMIRWSIQHGLVVIPKSTREERISENSQVFDFEISADDMRSLDSLNEDLRLNWDPTNIP
jgi:diketogulonate reductase-like aldo/keto reductase